MHSWSTFGARTNHEQTWTHNIHHDPNLGEVTTFPLIILSGPSHRAYTQMSFYLGTLKLKVPKFLKLGLSRLCTLITFCADLWLRWALKHSCTLIKSFPTICATSPTHKEIKAILDFQWLGIKSAIWLLALFLAITYV
jgi:hypothetical protein